MKRILLLSGLLIILFSACKKQTFNDSRQATIDDLKIQAYIKANNIDVVKDPSGLYYQIVTTNPGPHPTVTDTVQVSYVGKLLNGTVFAPETTPVLQDMPTAIKGWQIGLPMIGADHINKAARIRLIIPSALAYGSVVYNGYAIPVPANSCVDFTIDLIGFYN